MLLWQDLREKTARPASTIVPPAVFVIIREGAPKACRKTSTEATLRARISTNTCPFFAQQKMPDSAESRLSNSCVFVEFRAKKRARTKSTTACEIKSKSVN